MVELIPPPDPQRLLPPLLACLPTAFASHRPPPALLPLVSPILRQRLQLITSSSSSPSENWLCLLCWDKEKADELKDVVGNGTFEPHPTSGEIEIGEIGTTKYKRLDQETLRSQIMLSDWSLTALYLWCSESEGGAGWKLAELLPYDSDLERNPTWSQSIAEANESSRERMVTEAIQDAKAAELMTMGHEEDEDYWAQYDKTPTRTTAQIESRAPGWGIGHPEGDYYSRYSEVQPAMDSYDPSEDVNEIGNSSLHGDILATIIRRRSEHTENLASSQRKNSGLQTGLTESPEAPVSQLHPSSSSLSSSARSNPVARLEATAGQQPEAEIGIRQHISTTLKTLYGLANSAGMEREEFDCIIRRELELNSTLGDYTPGYSK